MSIAQARTTKCKHTFTAIDMLLCSLLSAKVTSMPSAIEESSENGVCVCFCLKNRNTSKDNNKNWDINI